MQAKLETWEMFRFCMSAVLWLNGLATGFYSPVFTEIICACCPLVPLVILCAKGPNRLIVQSTYSLPFWGFFRHKNGHLGVNGNPAHEGGWRVLSLDVLSSHQKCMVSMYSSQPSWLGHALLYIPPLGSRAVPI